MNPNNPIAGESQNNEQTKSVPDLELSGEQAEEIQAGTAYSPTFRGGVNVAAGDLN
jgi:hypothetical protein